MCPISSEGVTPPSSLLLAHVPLPLGSPLLRFLASFGESLQVVLSPCCPRELPDVISENLSLDAHPTTASRAGRSCRCIVNRKARFPLRACWEGKQDQPAIGTNSNGGRSRRCTAPEATTVRPSA